MNLLALLRGNSEEQINQQRIDINQYCEQFGYKPNFKTINSLEEIDLTSIQEKSIVHCVTLTTIMDINNFEEFMKSAEQYSISILLLENNKILDFSNLKINSNIFIFLSTYFRKYEIELHRQYAKKYALAYWTPERRAEHSLRMRDIHRKKKAQTP